MSGTYITNQAKGGGGGVYSVTNEAYGMRAVSGMSGFGIGARGDKASHTRFSRRCVCHVTAGVIVRLKCKGSLINATIYCVFSGMFPIPGV